MGPLGVAGGLAFDRQGNLYIADPSYNLIRKVDVHTNIITTVAGRKTADNYGFSGDGRPAVLARLEAAIDVALDAAGNVYVADETRVRKLTPSLASGAASNKLTR